MESIKTFKTWYERDLGRFAPWECCVEEAHMENPAGEKLYRYSIYTDNNQYFIRVDDSYLGCTATSRKSRAGEDWTRGNDLADGPFSEETWHRILGDIISYEMVSVTKRTEHGIPIPESAIAVVV